MVFAKKRIEIPFRLFAHLEEMYVETLSEKFKRPPYSVFANLGKIMKLTWRFRHLQDVAGASH